MPRLKGVNKVLIIGSGAIKIGEAGEFDYSGAQAIKAVKEEGVEVVLVNPNVATIQTDRKFVGDKAYFLPITPEFVEQVIEKEGPDGILLGFGGQTALNCGVELSERGVFERHGIRVLGTSIEAIERADDRELFRETMVTAGVPVPKSGKASSLEEALKVAGEIGYPVMVRVAYTLGGQGTGVAHNEGDLRRIAPIGFAHSRIHQILVEEYLGKWKEVEYEVLRDHDDACMIVCSMENFDPMGIHTGDSIVVAPSQTVSDELYGRLRETSFRVLRALGLVGECNIQYAVHPGTGEFRVIEVNSRLSRSSALASKATGYPIAYMTAKIALGYNLGEVVDPETRAPVAALEPDVDYVVVKMPRWDYQKFRRVNRRLGTQMKSVGEVMAIAKSFEESIQKAVRMLDIRRDLTDDHLSGQTAAAIEEELESPTDERLFYVMEALRRGMTVQRIHELSGITPFFLEGLKRITDFESELQKANLTVDVLLRGKQLGFSDEAIGRLKEMDVFHVRELRKRHGVTPYVKEIRTAKRWSQDASYLYLTYNADCDDIELPGENKIVVLGSGCYRIGSSVEFDWCCVNMAWALREKGVEEVIMVNCNPETVSTDYDVMDKLYFEELNLERILDILDKESPKGVVVSVGGQTANNLALKLESRGVRLFGTKALDIDRAEDRAKFSSLLDHLGIGQPRWSMLETMEQALAFSNEIGYPVLIRPSYVLSGAAMNVAYRDEQLESYLRHAAQVSRENPVVISKFVEGAREIEVDGVCDGVNVFLGAIIEHIEDAGVHSGDATMVIPTLNLGERLQEEIRSVSRKIARGLDIRGPFNIQYLVKGDEVNVIECNLRSSRSMPFVSKITGSNLMEYAAEAILGGKIPDGDAATDLYGVKSPQFSFMRLEGSDPLTGVEMVSTGEVACFGSSFSEAFLTSLIASGLKMPRGEDSVLMSVGEDKDVAVKIAEKFSGSYSLVATEGTARAIRASGVSCGEVYKISDGKEPSVLDIIEDGSVGLIINTPSPGNPQAVSDGYLMRRKAVEYGVPMITNLELANTLANVIKEHRVISSILAWAQAG